MNHNAVQLIQAMLAPGIMISACGLLLLGMNNKYSLIVNRIRLLKEEERKLYAKNDLNDIENIRINNIDLQISHLIHRISMVRNAVISYSVAIALFIVSCTLIGVQTDIAIGSFYWIILAFFYAGMLAVFIGIIFAAIEVWKGYRIVRIEISENYSESK